MRTAEHVHQLVVHTISARATTGLLAAGPLRLRCALGKAGRRAQKREGDGASPMGNHALTQVYYRPDCLLRPRTGLPIRRIKPSDGWCDETRDRNYNRPVTHPYPASAEHLWRQDHLYDLIVVVAYNKLPRIKGRGSAIFIHCARPGFAPTEGCIALRRSDLSKLLRWLSARTRICI